MKKMLLIVNPCSGKGKMKTELLKVVQVFSSADYEVVVYPTKARADATVCTAALKQGQYDLIVVCGGDGTLNEALTGLMQANIKCTLGYIPAGTLNEWSSSLGISRKIIEAARGIVSGREIDLDIGRFDDKYFSYTASFGAFTSASYSAPQKVKNVLGQSAYFFEGIKALAGIKPVHLKLVTAEREYEGDYLFGAVSNSMSVGGVVKFDKTKVELNDGLFEVLLIKKPESLIKFQAIIDGIMKKKFDCEEMEFFHTDKLTVIGGEGLSWTLDGEQAVGKDTVEIENVHSAMHLIVPQE